MSPHPDHIPADSAGPPPGPGGVVSLLPARGAAALTQHEIDAATLPASYRAARSALEHAVAIDEVADWADRAEALRSYARQSEDMALMNFAMKVKARAVRRCGELLAQIPSAQGAINQYTMLRGGTPPKHSRTAEADAAGLSRDQRRTALRVAAVPQAEFEAAVESDAPPTVTQMAARGTRRKPRDAAPAAPDQGDGPPDRFGITPQEYDRGLRRIAAALSSALVDDLIEPDPDVMIGLRPALARADADTQRAVARAAEFFAMLTE